MAHFHLWADLRKEKVSVKEDELKLKLNSIEIELKGEIRMMVVLCS